MGKRTGVIYEIRNTRNDKVYVGQTIVPLQRRFKKHLKANGTLLARAIKKYGQDAFYILAIEEAPRSELDRLECKWIEKLGAMAPSGYNSTAGGFGGTRTESVRKKIAVSVKKSWKKKKRRSQQSESLKRAWVDRDRRVSKEARIKMSEAARKHWHDPVVRKRMQRAQILARRLPADREQKSAIQKAKWRDQEYRRKQTAALAARKLPEDFRERMRIAMLKWWSKRKSIGDGHRIRG